MEKAGVSQAFLAGGMLADTGSYDRHDEEQRPGCIGTSRMNRPPPTKKAG
jgi:hypothetical protein